VGSFHYQLTGLGIVSVPAGLLASALSKARAIEKELLSKENSVLRK
jgi:hypothetical protein